MWITRQHVFSASLDNVLESLIDPSYAEFLSARHGFFREVRVLEMSHEQERVTRSVHYRAAPPFRKLGPFSIPASWFVWTEVSELDTNAMTLTFENVPQLASLRPKVVNQGKMVFRALPGGGTERTSTFEIDLCVSAAYRPFVDIAIQLVSRQVERALDEEAEVLSSWFAVRRLRAA